MEDIDYTLKEIFPENIEATLSEDDRTMECRSSLYYAIEAAGLSEIFLARDFSGLGGGLRPSISCLI